VSSDPTAVFVEHRGSLIAYATNIVGSRMLAEDLVQEAWVRLEEATRERLVGEPLAYLYRIIRNLALDGRRDSARQRQLHHFSHDNAPVLSGTASPSPEAVALYKDELRALEKALSELPRRTRIAVEMHRLGNYKLREIATFLGISLPLAHRLVAEGLEHCRERMEWW
jgi:RNA polymerase sigma-70 factor (ECF subfamily)